MPKNPKPGVIGLSLSRDGKTLAAVGNDGMLKLWNWEVETGERLFTFEGHKFDVGGLTFTTDNRFLISGSADTTIKFWDLKTGREARTLTRPASNTTN